ncbi:MAG: putative bifunctional diguanylate cyclase/phosphodiesterase [Halioglobus sp.]
MSIPDIRRPEFLKSLEQYVEQGKEKGTLLGLLLIDIGNLTQINHRFGYDQGDLLISEASGKLQDISKFSDTVFRVGSHHFGFILPGLTSPGFIALAVNKVTLVLEQDRLIGEETVPNKVNVGIAVGKPGEADTLSILSMAEASLAHIRRGGDHQLEKFSDQRHSAKQDFQLEKLFRETLHDNNFQLYYQPKINLATGLADHAEAVLRWQLSSGEFVSPERAVELAEALGSSYLLTKWILHTAFRQLKSWQKHSEMSMAINVQAELVSNPNLLALIEDSITIWGVEESSITLEITESAVIDDKESGFQNLTHLKNLGVELSIDDFGTGYSSMAYFKHIPAGELKIDQYFVKSMKDDLLDRELVRIMIDTAHLFDMRAVAEGIEDRESLELLQEMGCDYVQGYFFTRPLPAAEFEAWKENWSGL